MIIFFFIFRFSKPFYSLLFYNFLSFVIFLICLMYIILSATTFL